jgi:hypothetical protein
VLHHVTSKEDVIEVIFLHQKILSNEGGGNEEDIHEEVLIVKVVSRLESQFQDETLSS